MIDNIFSSENFFIFKIMLADKTTSVNNFLNNFNLFLSVSIKENNGRIISEYKNTEE